MFFEIDWVAVAKIVGLDILLGGDNAICIALACAGIPLAMRNKAMMLGTGAAVGLRILILAMAAFVIQIPFVKIAAGAMLFWIGYNLLVASEDSHDMPETDKVWQAVKNIAAADLVMSIDNVFAVTGASQSAGEHSMSYAIGGILLSIPIIMFGAKMISAVMDKFPIIIWAGAALLGWVGMEMILSDGFVAQYIEHGMVSKAIELSGALLVVAAAKFKLSKEVA